MRIDLPDELSVIGIDPATGNPATAMRIGLGGDTLTITVASAIPGGAPAQVFEAGVFEAGVFQ